LELHYEAIHLEANKGIAPFSAIRRKAMMNSSKIVLLAALAAMTVASHAFANSVGRTARLGVHAFATVPGSARGSAFGPGAPGFEAMRPEDHLYDAVPRMRRSNLNPRDPAYSGQ
jgi:hypothetical protein